MQAAEGGQRVSAVQQGPAQPDGAAEHPRDDDKDDGGLRRTADGGMPCAVLHGSECNARGKRVDGGSLMRGIPAGSVRLVYISELGQVS